MTIDHKYTVEEIAHMRVLTERLAQGPMHWTTQSQGYGHDYDPSLRSQHVEQRLRTCMMCGTRPEELEEQGRKLEEASERQRLAAPTDEEYAAIHAPIKRVGA